MHTQRVDTTPRQLSYKQTLWGLAWALLYLTNARFGASLGSSPLEKWHWNTCPSYSYNFMQLFFSFPLATGELNTNLWPLLGKQVQLHDLTPNLTFALLSSPPGLPHVGEWGIAHSSGANQVTRPWRNTCSLFWRGQQKSPWCARLYSKSCSIFSSSNILRRESPTTPEVSLCLRMLLWPLPHELQKIWDMYSWIYW